MLQHCRLATAAASDDEEPHCVGRDEVLQRAFGRDLAAFGRLQLVLLMIPELDQPLHVPRARLVGGERFSRPHVDVEVVIQLTGETLNDLLGPLEGGRGGRRR